MANHLLKAKSKLRKPRKAAKEHDANFSYFKEVKPQNEEYLNNKWSYNLNEERREREEHKDEQVDMN